MHVSSINKQLSGIKVWIFPVFSIAIACIVGLFVIKPWILDVIEKRGSVAENKTQRAVLIDKLEILRSQDELLLKDYLLRLTLAVPPKSSPPLILATVEKAIFESGMVVDSINFGGLNELSQSTISDLNNGSEEVNPLDTASVDLGTTTEEVVSGGKIAVQFSATGGYYQAVQFLKTIQSVNPMVLGVSFSIRLGVSSTSSSSNEDGSTSTVVADSFSYSGIAPFQELPTDLGAITTEVQSLSKTEQSVIDALDQYTTYFEVKSEVEQIQSYEVGRDNPF